MTTNEFIKKYNLKSKDVPRLYKIYLDLMGKDPIQALNLSQVITKLDKKTKLLTY